jgi:ABC-type lipoprotein export system ATPase subunit
MSYRNSRNRGDCVIEAVRLTKTYRAGEIDIPVLRGVSFQIAAGDFMAIVGASGCGKSTLLHLLGCLDRPTSGRYLLAGQDVGMLSEKERAQIRNRRIGFVFQSFNLLPCQTALENVTLPLLYDRTTTGRMKRSRDTLARVGLSDRTDHRPDQLSGGERQRVAIARALVVQPSIILADEPTGNLDSATGREILELIKELHAGGCTIVLVTHDPQVAATAEVVLRMQDGTLVETIKEMAAQKPDKRRADHVASNNALHGCE